MFKLVKSVNGRINTSEPRFITLKTALVSDISAHIPVIIANGAVTAVTADSTAKATHMLWKDGKSGDKTVWVIDLTPDMVFECPLTAAVSAGTGAYTEVAIGNGGTTGAAVASGKVGAILYDTIPAGAQIGDLVRVFFKGL